MGQHCLLVYMGQHCYSRDGVLNIPEKQYYIILLIEIKFLESYLMTAPKVKEIQKRGRKEGGRKGEKWTERQRQRDRERRGKGVLIFLQISELEGTCGRDCQLSVKTYSLFCGARTVAISQSLLQFEEWEVVVM